MPTTGSNTPTGERTPLLSRAASRTTLRPNLSYADLALSSAFSVSNESAFTFPGAFTPAETISRDEETIGEPERDVGEPPLRDDLWVILGAMWCVLCEDWTYLQKLISIGRVGSFLSALE